MEDLSLHILDLAENCITAESTLVRITVFENPPGDELVIEIVDNGSGMTAEQLRQVRDPFYTTRDTRRIGLGVPLFARSCEEAGGSLEIESAPGEGCKLRGTMQYGHIDRKPLGDMVETVITLIMSAPQIDWEFRHARVRPDGETALVELDTRQVREQVGIETITHPEVVRAMRRSLREQTAQLND